MENSQFEIALSFFEKVLNKGLQPTKTNLTEITDLSVFPKYFIHGFPKSSSYNIYGCWTCFCFMYAFSWKSSHKR